MVNPGGALYVDTSALMRALLEQDRELLESLRDATVRVTSSLTFTEAPRTLWRAVRTKRISPLQQQQLLEAIREFESQCRTIALEQPVLERAREEFPVEFVGTLDSLHLASALLYAHRIGPVTIASTDERMRANARALGLRVIPYGAGAG